MKNSSSNIAKIKLNNISKKFGKKMVLEDISCEIFQGEFVSILGPSGCGKTTLLRIIMGIEQPSRGEVLKDGIDITHLEPSKRNIGMVFQNYALFPNMNVFENIAFALKAKRFPKKEIEQKVLKAIKDLGLEEHAFKRPSQLSGGQQQRVAIARTLVLNPDVLLFDEPMSALDEDIKLQLRKVIKNLQKSTGVTMIYITHDQEESFAMSDRVMVINDCKIAQFDAPKQIYHNPADEFVKSFVVDHLEAKLASIESQIK